MRTKLLCGVETGDLRKIGKSVEKHPDRREIVRLMQLRRACENKEALGEQGEGNCRRYRQVSRR